MRLNIAKHKRNAKEEYEINEMDRINPCWEMENNYKRFTEEEG